MITLYIATEPILKILPSVLLSKLPVKEMQEMWVTSPGQEVPLEEEMTTHSGILAWETPWAEEPGGLQPIGAMMIHP